MVKEAERASLLSAASATNQVETALRGVGLFASRSDPRLDVGETLLTVAFVDVNGDTRVRLRHEGFSTAERRDNHSYGWSATSRDSENCSKNKQN